MDSWSSLVSQSSQLVGSKLKERSCFKSNAKRDLNRNLNIYVYILKISVQNIINKIKKKKRDGTGLQSRVLT